MNTKRKTDKKVKKFEKRVVLRESSNRKSKLKKFKTA